jgi:hypothetical protein
MRATAWRELALRCLFGTGVASLTFLLGAAVVHFKLPTSELLDKAFTGGRAWSERQAAEAAEVERSVPAATVGVDQPARTCDGFTAYATDRGTEVRLIDMRGKVVHHWAACFRDIWPTHPHVTAPVRDEHIFYFDGHVYPGGELLVVLHGVGDTPYGYGLAKLDRESRVLWSYAANVHHSVDVGDDGVIYALTQKVVHEVPADLKWLTVPCLVDTLVLLSPEGAELQSIPILEAFHDSPYAALLSQPSPRDVRTTWDVLHTNRAAVLTRALAPHFPRFRAGDVLISVRELDTLAVLRPECRRVVWAARGAWRAQHDPQFLGSGRLLVFDNRGSGGYARVLEYDPDSQACPWVYSGADNPPLVSDIQGRAQRLANGNTLIVNSQGGDLYEVSPAKELAWSCACHATVPWARRYRPDQLPFIQGASHARP